MKPSIRQNQTPLNLLILTQSQRYFQTRKLQHRISIKVSNSRKQTKKSSSWNIGVLLIDRLALKTSFLKEDWEFSDRFEWVYFYFDEPTFDDAIADGKGWHFEKFLEYFWFFEAILDFFVETIAEPTLFILLLGFAFGRAFIGSIFVIGSNKLFIWAWLFYNWLEIDLPTASSFFRLLFISRLSYIQLLTARIYCFILGPSLGWQQYLWFTFLFAWMYYKILLRSFVLSRTTSFCFPRYPTFVDWMTQLMKGVFSLSCRTTHLGLHLSFWLEIDISPIALKSASQDFGVSEFISR